MTQRTTRWVLLPISSAFVTLLAACGSDNGTPPPTATPTLTATATRTVLVVPTPTATPTRTPTSVLIPHPTPSRSRTATPLVTATPTQPTSGVQGLVVVNRDVMSGPGDVLGAPPAPWQEEKDGASFDRSFSYADWSIAGSPGHIGLTGPDGSFSVTGLPPGRHTLNLSKTLGGNLAAVSVPFAVGPDGSATVVVEVAWGLAKSTSSYADNGHRVQDVRGPYGTWVTTRDDHISELGDPSRTLVDADGDGRFDVLPCVDQVWECGADRNCGSDRVCACTASCPFCDDCGPGVCVPPARVSPYGCGPDDTCAQSGDRCVCVSSCPDCTDCTRKVCVPDCTALEITAIELVGGPTELVVGQQGVITAVARLSDGSSVDVTHLVTRHSSNEAIATVDSWGRVIARSVGTVTLTASLGTLTSAAWTLSVVDRPTLRRIEVQNVSCYYPLGVPTDFGSRPPISAPPASGALPPMPSCGLVVQIGRTIQFRAVGEFANGYYQDITEEVQWQLTPSAVGDVAQGLFTARQAGTASLTASLNGVTSNTAEIRVVTEPTITALSIYADGGIIAFVDGGPVRVDVAIPCLAAPQGGPCCCPGPLADATSPCDCGYTITVLRGDEVKFRATAQYDTGDFRDVTSEVTWRTSNAAAATIDADGVMIAVEAGDTTIDAALGAVTSNDVGAHVVNQATLLSLYIYQEGTDRVVAKGDQRFFKATGSYDVGFARDVTGVATWRSSNDSVGGFDTPGVFTARTAGMVQVWAELDGKQSDRLSLEVYETSDITYCDPAHVNRSAWSDNFNRVILESDCGFYRQPNVVGLRYTVTELQPHGGIFDPCLDLYVYQGDRRVRTIREEGCGDPFLPNAAPGRDEAVVKYQLRAFWDLKDETGQPVPPGTYKVYGRFYLYYDPVVSIDVTVLPADGRLADLLPTRVYLGRCSLDTCVPKQMLTVCVANQGEAPAGSFLVQVNNQETLPFAPLGVGIEACAEVPYRGAVTLVADATNTVFESREDNNRSSVTAPIPGPTGCDFVPADCTPLVTPTPTPTPAAVCTPPLCKPGEVFYCRDHCPGGCGTICVKEDALGSIDVGSATGMSGDIIQFSVSLRTGGQQVAGTQNDLFFDPAISIAAQANGRPNCEENPDIDKGSSVFAFIPIGCRPGVDCSGIRAIVVATDNSAPIPDQSVLYTCKVSIASDTAPGSYLLVAAGVVASDPLGGRLFATASNGEITVVGRPGETPRPRTPTPTAAGQRPSATPTPDGFPVCTPPLCKDGEVLHCSGFCSKGCGVVCRTPTPTPFCTPVSCPSDQVPYCPGGCNGGCPSACAIPTPTRTPEGVCFRGASCSGAGIYEMRNTCCEISQLSASPVPFSWCPLENWNFDTGTCAACAGDPCGDVPPTPSIKNVSARVSGQRKA